MLVRHKDGCGDTDVHMGDETEQYVAKRQDGEMRARPERKCATCLETKKMREG